MPALYLADSIALAVLEITVHAVELPDDYLLTKFLIDDDLIEALDVTTLPEFWRDEAEAETLRNIGNKWSRSKRSAVLKVPSIVVPQEFNLVVNTEHLAFPSIEHRDLGGFQFDRRLRPSRHG